MEKLLNPYEKECMRMAMLKHEETFKQQVYELHRLYQVQKILMKNMEEINRSNQQLRNLNNNVKVGVGFIRRVEDVDVREELRIKFDGSDIEIMDESEIELTLGPTCYARSRKKKSSESPGDSDSRRSLSSSSTGSSNNRGINGSSSVVSEEQTRQERLMKQQQPWLHVLSLNVT